MHPATRGILVLALLVVLSSGGTAAHAHLPRVVSADSIVAVERPGVSQAFYAPMGRVPGVFSIEMAEPFSLYIGLLVPDLPGISTELTAELTRTSGPVAGEGVMVLEGRDFPWEPFFEPFAGDRYLRGPHREVDLPAGSYRVEVSGAPGVDRYVFVIGKREEFTAADILHTVAVLPGIKRDFFGRSPFAAALSLMGLAGAFILFAFLLIGWILYRRLRRTGSEN